MLNNRGLNLPVTYSRLQKVPGFFSALQRIQEIHEIGHILCAETDVKPDIIEVDQSSQSGCVAAVEIGGTCCHSAKNRSLHLTQIVTLASDDPKTWIGGLKDVVRVGRVGIAKVLN